MSPDTQWLLAHPFVLFFLVALASESGGRGATHLKPRLPQDVPQGQLVGDFLHSLRVTVHRLLHGFQDFLESGLSGGSEWVSLPGVFGKIEEQRRVMVGDEVPVAETHVGGKAAVGALRGELGREEEGFPDGRACGSQGQEVGNTGKQRHDRGHAQKLRCDGLEGGGGLAFGCG